jgi:hypothetical protein
MLRRIIASRIPVLRHDWERNTPALLQPPLSTSSTRDPPLLEWPRKHQFRPTKLRVVSAVGASCEQHGRRGPPGGAGDGEYKRRFVGARGSQSAPSRALTVRRLRLRRSRRRSRGLRRGSSGRRHADDLASPLLSPRAPARLLSRAGWNKKQGRRAIEEKTTDVTPRCAAMKGEWYGNSHELRRNLAHQWPTGQKWSGQEDSWTTVRCRRHGVRDTTADG